MSKKQNSTVADDAQDILNDILGKYGEDSVTTLKDIKFGKVNPSGSFALDAYSGIRGIPDGCFIDISGEESSSKSTTGYALILERLRQNPDKIAAIIDTEDGLNSVIGKQYLEGLGFDLSEGRLLVITPPEGVLEYALEIIYRLLESGKCCAIMVDSVNAAQVKKREESEVGASLMGNKAKLLSQEIQGVRRKARKAGCIFITINQLRDKIGPMARGGKTTSGGNAIKYAADLQLRMSKPWDKTNKIFDDSGAEIGGYFKCKIFKTKIFPRKGEFLIPILNGKGVSLELELLMVGIDLGLVLKKGGWHKLNDAKKPKDCTVIGNGAKNALQFLLDNPDVAAQLKADILAK